MASVSSSNEAPGTVHLDMITHMLNQGGGAHKAIDRESLYQEGARASLSFSLSPSALHPFQYPASAQHEVVESAEKLVTMKEKADRELDSFVRDPKLTSIGFPPMDKVCRYLVYACLPTLAKCCISWAHERRPPDTKAQMREGWYLTRWAKRSVVGTRSCGRSTLRRPRKLSSVWVPRER